MEPLLTSLVTGVGTATAKGALKRWLKDYPEALAAGVRRDSLKGWDMAAQGNALGTEDRATGKP